MSKHYILKILILTGGDSSERKISFISARNVKKSLIEGGHKAKIYDLRSGYNPIKKLAEKFDILFPVLHGDEGEGGKLHKFISKIDKPIAGTRNYKGMESAWYKIPFKKYSDKNGILTPSWKLVKNKKEVLDFGFPCVLKASNSGSSREVVVLHSKRDLNSYAFKKLIKLNVPIFVEKYVEGAEVTAGILNNKALPLIEIIPPLGQWFSYKNKYSSATKEIPFAPSLSKSRQEKLQKIALEIHKHFNLGSYSRIDFMVDKENIYAIEVNTIPGLTPESLMPKAAKASGISFNEFLEILLKTAK